MSLHVLTLSWLFGFGLCLPHHAYASAFVGVTSDYKVREMKTESKPQSTAVIQWTLLSSGLHCSVFVAAGFQVWL